MEIMEEEEEQKGIIRIHKSGCKITDQKDKQPPVLFLLSGFPDSVTTWNEFKKLFEQEYHVVSMAYPGMDINYYNQQNYPLWGYTIKDVSIALLSIIQEYRNVFGCNEIYLLGHDWGSIPVMYIAYHYPDVITKVITEDIGMILNPFKQPLYEKIVMTSYMTYFVLLFIITRFIPIINESILFQFFIRIYPWKTFGPLPNDNDFIISNPYQLYPYYQYIKDVIITCKTYPFGFSKVPLLYIYGNNKRCLFHSTDYIEKLQKTPGCNILEMKQAGHWIHCTHTKEMAQSVMDFIEEEK